VSDINTAVVDSLKVLDPNRPIREADNRGTATFCPLMDKSGHWAVLTALAVGLVSACQRNQIRKREVTMWFSIWAVTIALAIGFSVTAVAMQSESGRATFGR
jgi:hypothetical protein